MSEEEYKELVKYLKIGGIFITILIAFACVLKTVYETYDVYVMVENIDEETDDMDCNNAFSYMNHHR